MANVLPDASRPDHRDDIDQIRRLKYRCVRLLDTKQWDEFAACFTPDSTAD